MFKDHCGEYIISSMLILNQYKTKLEIQDTKNKKEYLILSKIPIQMEEKTNLSSLS